MQPFPPWMWAIPEHFNIGVACTDAHLGTAVASRTAVLVDHDASTDEITFAGLAERTSRFAQLLRELGCEPGDRVLVRLPNCLAYPTAFLGALKRGAVPVPTSTMLTADEVRFLATDSGAVVLVTDRASWDAMRGVLETLPALREVLLVDDASSMSGGRLRVRGLESLLAGVGDPEPPHPTRAEDPAYLVYTSGTTGYPKGVLHAHRALLGRQPSSEYWFDFDPAGDRVLHAGKYNWTYVLGTGLMDPLFRGHTTIVHEGETDATRWPERIARHGATIFIGVPTIYRQILQKTTFGRADVPTLRHCMCAGEQLSADVLGAWRERFGLEIYEALGMTECSYYLCQTRARPVRPGSAGFVQPGHDVRLLDPASLREVEEGGEGMLCIRRGDPGLMLRYWNRPEETAACVRGDWFLTGDYARRDADGYVWFLGRRDDLINSFGYRISPHEVERVMRAHPEVADAAAVGEAIAADKTLVVAYVVPRAKTLTAAAVLAYAQEHLAAYKSPRIVYLVDELPRTRNGKVLRRALRPDRARARAETPAPHPPGAARRE
jgi:acetyl-CoA synthetase